MGNVTHKPPQPMFKLTKLRIRSNCLSNDVSSSQLAQFDTFEKVKKKNLKTIILELKYSNACQIFGLYT